MKAFRFVFAVCAVLGFASTSSALVTDPNTSVLGPANALVVPFDATTNRSTFITVSNLAGTSDLDNAKVSTHWAFWGEDCSHLVDVSICLTLNDTVVVDVSDIHNVNEKNEAGSTNIDLTGHRGTAIVTAFATGKDCSGATDGTALVDDAIVGSFQVADTTTGASFGGNAIGLGVKGGKTVLPDASLISSVNVQTFRPGSLTASDIIFVALREGAGSILGEVGPLNAGATTSSFLRASVDFYDIQEVRTSLPDSDIACTLFTSAVDGIIPSTVTPSSSGVIQLSDFRLVTPTLVGESVSSDLAGTFVYGFHGQAVGGYSGMNYATYIPAFQIIE